MSRSDSSPVTSSPTSPRPGHTAMRSPRVDEVLEFRTPIPHTRPRTPRPRIGENSNSPRGQSSGIPRPLSLDTEGAGSPPKSSGVVLGARPAHLRIKYSPNRFFIRKQPSEPVLLLRPSVPIWTIGALLPQRPRAPAMTLSAQRPTNRSSPVDLLTRELRTLYRAKAEVTGFKSLFTASHWSNMEDPSLYVISVNIVVSWGAVASEWRPAGNHGVRVEISEGEEIKRILTPASMALHLSSALVSSTPELVSRKYLDLNPDLAYNVPFQVKLIAQMGKQTRTLGQGRSWIDIGQTGATKLELMLNPGWRFEDGDDALDIQVKILRSEAFRENDTNRTLSESLETSSQSDLLDY